MTNDQGDGTEGPQTGTDDIGSATTSNERGVSDSIGQPPPYAPPPKERFDWRGWLLVGIILVSFVLIPIAILYIPAAGAVLAAMGVSWRQAYLVLPLIPAVLLGATAVWAAVSSRSTE